MRTIIAILPMLIVSCISLHAQTLTYQFARQSGRPPADIAVDATGNTYTIGNHKGTYDFDPGAGVHNITADSVDVVIVKFDASDNFVWAFKLGGPAVDEACRVAVDRDGNVIVNGTFRLTVDFDPGPGTFNMTADSSSYDSFIAKYDPNGALLWAEQIHTPKIGDGPALGVDSTGNIIVCGSFSGQVDFDPGNGETILESVPSATGSLSDLYVSKYASDGSFIWAFGIGGPGIDQALALALDKDGNIYVTGSYGGGNGIIVNFNPLDGPEVYLPYTGGTDAFVAKYSTTMEVQWAFRIGGTTGADAGLGISTDGKHVAVTGYFAGSVNFNPDAGDAYLDAASVQNIFVAQYSDAGTYQFAFPIIVPVCATCGGGFGKDIEIDDSGDVHVAGGSIDSLTDFDPGPATKYVQANHDNAFVATYSSTGKYRSALAITATTNSNIRGIAVNVGRDVYVVGGFAGTADFDPTSDSATLVSTDGTGYIAKYSSEKQSAVHDVVGQRMNAAPNPFNDHFILRLDSTLAASRIQIIDVMGRVVETMKVGESNSDIDLGSELPAGAYVVQITRGVERKAMLVHKVK